MFIYFLLRGIKIIVLWSQILYYFEIVLWRYNWYTTNCTYFMCIIWLIWTYANIHDTITTFKVIGMCKTSHSFLGSICLHFVSKFISINLYFCTVFSFHYSSCLPLIQCFPLWSFSFYLKNIFNVCFSIDSQVTNSVLSENTIIPPLSLQNIFYWV